MEDMIQFPFLFKIKVIKVEISVSIINLSRIIIFFKFKAIEIIRYEYYIQTY